MAALFLAFFGTFYAVWNYQDDSHFYKGLFQASCLVITFGLFCANWFIVGRNRSLHRAVNALAQKREVEVRCSNLANEKVAFKNTIENQKIANQRLEKELAKVRSESNSLATHLQLSLQTAENSLAGAYHDTQAAVRSFEAARVEVDHKQKSIDTLAYDLQQARNSIRELEEAVSREEGRANENNARANQHAAEAAQAMMDLATERSKREQYCAELERKYEEKVKPFKDQLTSVRSVFLESIEGVIQTIDYKLAHIEAGLAAAGSNKTEGDVINANGTQTHMGIADIKNHPPECICTACLAATYGKANSGVKKTEPRKHILVEFNTGQKSYVNRFVGPEDLPQYSSTLNYELGFGDDPFGWAPGAADRIRSFLIKDEGIRSISVTPA